ncbi:hypothetical protein B9Z55_007885 [Caenorhabditis nigoni]|uniref:Uncharacterized protein n=1 Tax=Caenorhabditis nigoni TaxID=1611254 RepID=A0A2G5VBM9_9PELO|nr:hypothetical protein B9Z55_007885 [Caenorhabditis nigoni]
MFLIRIRGGDVGFEFLGVSVSSLALFASSLRFQFLSVKFRSEEISTNNLLVSFFVQFLTIIFFQND